METGGGGILGRVGERVLSWLVFGLIVLAGVGIWALGPDGRAALWSGIWRTTAWLLIVAALPWIGRLFVRRVLDAGTNWAGVVWLVGLLLADIIAAVLLMTAWPMSGWGWFAVVAVVAAVGTYNFLVTEYLADQAGG